MATSDFSTGKTIFVLAIVVGCFAILWPRVFHPIVQTAFSMTKPQINNEKSANARPAAGCCDVVYDYDINNNFFARLCELVVHRQEMVGTKEVKGPPSVSLLPKEGTPGVTQMCRDKVLELCHVDIGSVLTVDPKTEKYAEILEDLRSQNVSYCLRRHYEKHEKFVELAQKMRHRRFLTARKQQTRPAHSPLLHPAMRERGVPIATRIREPFAHKQKVPSESLMGGRPGAPTGHSRMPPPIVKGGGSGSMGFIMPMYTVGIVVFFIYTVMKFWKQIRARALVLFKRSEDSQESSFKAYPVDPEYRKFVLSQQYGEPVPSYQEFLRIKEEKTVGKRVLEDDDQKLMFTAIEGIIAEMDEFRERINTTEATTVIDKAEIAVDAKESAFEAPTPRQTEENGSATLIAHSEETKSGSTAVGIPTVVVGEPKIAPVQMLRDSLQAQMSLEDSDLLPTIPEDAKFAVVGVETVAVFDGRAGTPTPFARSPTPNRLLGRGTSPGRAVTPDERPDTMTPTPTTPIPTPEPSNEKLPPPLAEFKLPAEVPNIFLETNIPSEMQILVSESQMETIPVRKTDGGSSETSTIEASSSEGASTRMGEDEEFEDDEEEEQPVIIAGKMTISLIDMQANHVESTSPTTSAPPSPGGTSVS